MSAPALLIDRKSTRLNSSHTVISYAVFCLNKIDRQLLLDRAVVRFGGLDVLNNNAGIVIFFFNDTATTEIYTLPYTTLFRSLAWTFDLLLHNPAVLARTSEAVEGGDDDRSEEHTSELQSHSDLVCRLLLE